MAGSDLPVNKCGFPMFAYYPSHKWLVSDAASSPPNCHFPFLGETTKLLTSFGSMLVKLYLLLLILIPSWFLGRDLFFLVVWGSLGKATAHPPNTLKTASLHLVLRARRFRKASSMGKSQNLVWCKNGLPTGNPIWQWEIHENQNVQKVYPLANKHSYGKLPICKRFIYSEWRFSIATFLC